MEAQNKLGNITEKVQLCNGQRGESVALIVPQSAGKSSFKVKNYWVVNMQCSKMATEYKLKVVYEDTKCICMFNYYLFLSHYHQQ